jgi:signal transduction histidine kinase
MWFEFLVAPIGKSLRGRWLFTFVLEDITDMMNMESLVQQSQRALDSQNSFFTKMIHELWSPLSGLLGMISLLQDTSLTTEQTDLLKTI